MWELHQSHDAAQPHSPHLLFFLQLPGRDSNHLKKVNGLSAQHCEMFPQEKGGLVGITPWDEIHAQIRPTVAEGKFFGVFQHQDARLNLSLIHI